MAGMWHVKGERRNTDKGICILCAAEKFVRQLLLDCLENRNWRIKV
jgi:hypothetical protein